MTIIQKILKKKRKSANPQCPITKEPIEQGFGYLLTTSQVVQSRKYWDRVMTEPETLSYTLSHFQNQVTGTHMRNLIFEKYSSINHPWMISDSCIELFDVNRTQARDLARKWWESDGTFVPEKSGAALDQMNPGDYNEWKDYAVLEAGRARVELVRARNRH